MLGLRHEVGLIVIMFTARLTPIQLTEPRAVSISALLNPGCAVAPVYSTPSQHKALS